MLLAVQAYASRSESSRIMIEDDEGDEERIFWRCSVTASLIVLLCLVHVNLWTGGLEWAWHSIRVSPSSSFGSNWTEHSGGTDHHDVAAVHNHHWIASCYPNIIGITRRNIIKRGNSWVASNKSRIAWKLVWIRIRDERREPKSESGKIASPFYLRTEEWMKEGVIGIEMTEQE